MLLVWENVIIMNLNWFQLLAFQVRMFSVSLNSNTKVAAYEAVGLTGIKIILWFALEFSEDPFCGYFLFQDKRYTVEDLLVLPIPGNGRYF